MLKRALLPIALGLLGWWQVRGGPFHWSCPFRLATHHPCPTCGFTTATRALLHLRFADATHLNPLACVVLPLLAAFASGELGAFVVTGKFGFLANRKPVRVVALGVCVALFAVWIARFCGAFGGPLKIE